MDGSREWAVPANGRFPRMDGSREWAVPVNGSQLWDAPVPITLCYFSRKFTKAKDHRGWFGKPTVRMKFLHTLVKAV